jgi:DNA-binding transcriptional MocR family regulator
MDTINLGTGDPETELLPLDELREAAAHRLSLGEKGFLNYVVPEQGDPAFRKTLAGFLTRHYRCPVDPENLLVTAGASHALDLVLKHYARPGDTVLVEDPTYHLALDIVRDYDVQIVPVPVDARGLNTEALARCLHAPELRAHKAALLYTIPLFHNPSGTTLPVERRRELIELAREHDFVIAADEVYQTLGDADHTPPPLSTFGRDRVLSLGSFSKILAPGLRLGWIECASAHMSVLARDGMLVSGGALNALGTAIALSAIELGIQDRYLASVRVLYARRRRAMVQALRAYLPEPVRFVEPFGGFFVWLELPSSARPDALIEDARKAGVLLQPGTRFSISGRHANCLRLCFACHSTQRINEGCERLGRVLSGHMGP